MQRVNPIASDFMAAAGGAQQASLQNDASNSAFSSTAMRKSKMMSAVAVSQFKVVKPASGEINSEMTQSVVSQPLPQQTGPSAQAALEVVSSSISNMLRSKSGTRVHEQAMANSSLSATDSGHGHGVSLSQPQSQAGSGPPVAKKPVGTSSASGSARQRRFVTRSSKPTYLNSSSASSSPSPSPSTCSSSASSTYRRHTPSPSVDSSSSSYSAVFARTRSRKAEVNAGGNLMTMSSSSASSNYGAVAPRGSSKQVVRPVGSSHSSTRHQSHVRRRDGSSSTVRSSDATHSATASLGGSLSDLSNAASVVDVSAACLPSGSSRRGQSADGAPEAGVDKQVSYENTGERPQPSDAASQGNDRLSTQTSTEKQAAGASSAPLGVETESFQRRVEAAQRARLYLLQQSGPNAFLVCDPGPPVRKFKVIIGPQTCACGRPLCVHLLFVMLRVFRSAPADPLLASRQLKNFEVETLFRHYNDFQKARFQKAHARLRGEPIHAHGSGSDAGQSTHLSALNVTGAPLGGPQFSGVNSLAQLAGSRGGPRSGRTEERASNAGLGAEGANAEPGGMHDCRHDQRNPDSRQSSTPNGDSPQTITSNGSSDQSSSADRITPPKEEEEETCPICLLEMRESEDLVKCRFGCQNYYHNTCITIWFDECRSQGELLYCPLCRMPWERQSGSGAYPAVSRSTSSNSSGYSNTGASGNANHAAGHCHYQVPAGSGALRIPDECRELARSWIEAFNETIIARLFSRTAELREAGIRNLTDDMNAVLLVSQRPPATQPSAEEQRRQQLHKAKLKAYFDIMAHVTNDPVYKVFVALLRSLRSVFSRLLVYSGEDQIALQRLVRPICNSILVKAADRDDRMARLAESTLIELARGQDGDLPLGTAHEDYAKCTFKDGLGGLQFLLHCILKDSSESTDRQAILGRLITIDYLFGHDAFQQHFIVHRRVVNVAAGTPPPTTGGAPNFAIAAIGNPQNTNSCTLVGSNTAVQYVNRDRLISIVNYTLSAINSSHERIGRMARRVFILAARFAADVPCVFQEIEEKLNCLDSAMQHRLRKRLRLLADEFGVAREIAKLGLREAAQAAPAAPAAVPVAVAPASVCQQQQQQSVVSNTILASGSSRQSQQQQQQQQQQQHQQQQQTQVSRPPTRIQVNATVSDHYAAETDDGASRYASSVYAAQSSASSVYQAAPSASESSIIYNISLQVSSAPTGTTLRTVVEAAQPSPAPAPAPASVSTPAPSSATSSNAVSCLSTPAPQPTTPASPFSLNNNNLASRCCSSSCSQSVTSSANNTPAARKDCQRPSLLATRSNNNTSMISMSLEKDEDDEDDDEDFLRGTKTSHFGGNTGLGQSQMHAKGDKACSAFHSEVADACDSSTYGEYCYCKEEIAREEALALVIALEASMSQPDLPIVPGLRNTLPLRDEREQVRTGTEKEDVIYASTELLAPTAGTPSEAQPTVTVAAASSSSSAISTTYAESKDWCRGPVIGTGAFSTCYQARDVRTGTLMAVKQISFIRNTESEQRAVMQTIRDEINLLARLNHPNVLRILGATQQGTHFSIFFEWMSGGSVSSVLEKYGPFCESVICQYMQQILRGLVYLHSNAIIHRDLKGANILVSSTGQQVRIADFGTAARLSCTATNKDEFRGQLIGTVAFTAPEILRGEHYGRSCDIWSIGCCLIEMFTGRPPWNASQMSNHLALIYKIASANGPPPIPPNMSPALKDAVRRCVEIKPEDRPNATELLQHAFFTRYYPRKKGSVDMS